MVELVTNVFGARAESPYCFGARVGGRHALRDEPRDALGEKRFELVVDLRVEIGLVARRKSQEATHAGTEIGAAHRSIRLAASTVVIASKWSTSRSDSARRCARPAVVSL